MSIKLKLRRDVNGVLLLNKPKGITSNDALQIVKRIYNAKKAGHTGSLDKPATGMLPLCLGEATKFTSYLLNADKHYIANCKLGVITTTADSTGDVIKTSDVPDLNEKKLRRVLSEFTGNIQQIPPMFSAIKRNGKRLYELAYEGKVVEREPREVSIYNIELISLSDDEFSISVHCSKGTYIRTLAEDIGNRIGCGGHILDLERTSVSYYSSKNMISMDDLYDCAETGEQELDKLLLPVDSIINDIPEITLTNSSTHYITNGQAVMVPHAPTEGLIKIYNENHDFMGVGEILEDGRVAPRRLVNLSTI